MTACGGTTPRQHCPCKFEARLSAQLSKNTNSNHHLISHLLLQDARGCLATSGLQRNPALMCLLTHKTLRLPNLQQDGTNISTALALQCRQRTQCAKPGRRCSLGGSLLIFRIPFALRLLIRPVQPYGRAGFVDEGRGEVGR